MGDFNAENKKRFKPGFLTDLEAREIGVDKWELLDDLVYHSKLIGMITAPKGFVTDFDSTPRWVPIAYSLFKGKCNKQAAIHDLLYQKHICSKHKADRIFLEAMKSEKIPSYIRWPMYLGVVMGGQSSYNSGPERFTVLNK